MPRGVKRVAPVEVDNAASRQTVQSLRRSAQKSPDSSYPKIKSESTALYDDDESPSRSIGYHHLVDHEYGVTPQHQIMREAPAVPPKTSEAVKRRLNMSEIDGTEVKAPLPQVRYNGDFKTPKRRSGKSASIAVKKMSERTSRYDTSLSLLTQRFVHLLKTSPNGVIDLNTASAKLDVKKRRIYDITNVLEGIGILEKKSKNNIQWKCGNAAETNRISQQRKKLDREIRYLAAKEKEIDSALATANKDLQHLSEDKRFAYVTYVDLKGIEEFKDQTVIPIKAPPETQLFASRSNGDSHLIRMKAESGEIEVFVCQKLDNSPVKQENSWMDDGQSILKPLFDGFHQSNLQSPLKATTKTLHISPDILDDVKLSPVLKDVLKRKVVVGRAQRNLTATFTGQPSENTLPNVSGVTNNKVWNAQVLKTSQPNISLEKKTDLSFSPNDMIDIKMEGKLSPISRIKNPIISDVENFGYVARDSLPSHFEDKYPLDFSPVFDETILSLDPPITDSDYMFNLDPDEGIFELFDLDYSNLPMTSGPALSDINSPVMGSTSLFENLEPQIEKKKQCPC